MNLSVSKNIKLILLRKIVLGAIEVFMLLTIAVICFYIQSRLTFFYLPLDNNVLLKLLKVMPLVLLVKVILMYKDKFIWLSLPVTAVFYLAFPKEHYLYEAFFCFLIVGCVGINIRKIFYAAFIPSTLVIINMMIASLSGAIDSLATVSRDIRSYWGHISPTDFGTAILFIVIFAWLIFKDLPDEFFLIPSLFSLYISFGITRSNTSGRLTLVFMAILLWRVLEKRVLEKKEKLGWMIKTVNVLLRLSFPLLGLLMIVMVFAYFKEIPYAQILDTVFHKRISIPSNMLAKYGLKPFGTYFDMYGNGGSTISMITEYTFIDSSYPQILIRYGWVTYIIVNILWVFTTDRAIRTDNRRLAFSMSVVAMDFFMEHHWNELCYNVFLVLPFADFSLNAIKEPEVIKEFKESWADRKYKLAFIAMAVIGMIALFLALPVMFSYQRTIFNGYGFTGKKVFFIATALVLIVIFILWNLSAAAGSFAASKRVAVHNGILLAIGVVSFIALALRANSMVNALTLDLTSRIGPEADMVNFITDSASGKVYADKYPEAYRRCDLDIARSYFNGEDMARYDCATVIVDADKEFECLTGRGFLYLPISDEDAIYTNDEALISTLKGEGYILKGYNTYEHHVDLNHIANINGLGKSDDGGVFIDDSAHQIWMGPYVDLKGGKYTVTYNLHLENEPYEEDYQVGTLLLTSYYGEKELTKVAIMRSFFDENGEFSYKIPFTGYGRAYEFKVLSEDTGRFEVKSIEYTRTPDYDVHYVIDNKGRATRTEYYNLDGTPREMEGGYYGLENEYNEQDLAIMTRYLGDDFKPTLVSTGYCIARRLYNRNKQLISEAYYDVEDEPICLSDGYHSYMREYDFVGNVKAEEYYGIEGEPVLYKGSYHKYTRIFNEERLWTNTEYYDTEDKLIDQKEGFAVAERDYDEDGNLIEERYFDHNRERVLYNGAYYRIVRAYDDEKRCIHEEYYDTEDNLFGQPAGYVGVDKIYDEAGDVVDLIYLGEDLKPVVTSSGFAEVRKEYTLNKGVSREEYFDEKGSPIALSGGQAVVVRTFDKNNSILSEEYYGTGGERILISGKYFRYTHAYNEKNQCIQEKYYDTEENPILVSGGYAGYDRSFDDDGNIVHATYLGLDGKPIMTDWGYSICHRAFNEEKQIVREEYYDVNDEKTTRPSGQHAVEYTYDDFGNCNSDSYFGIDNERILVNGSFWKVERIYNENKKVIHEEYFGIDGKHILISGSYSSVDYAYSENNVLVKKIFKDIAGNVVDEQIVE